MSKEVDPSYLRCEQDIVAWLMTQVPVPVCEGLILRIRNGDHRGCGPDLDRQWEIPITLKDERMDPDQIDFIRRLIRTVGGELMLSDETGKWVVVPMFRAVDEVQLGLTRLHVHVILSVGAANRFNGGAIRVLRETLTHILQEGRTLCGYPTGFPKDWPEGLYTDLKNADDATCTACIEVAAFAADRRGPEGNQSQ